MTSPNRSSNRRSTIINSPTVQLRLDPQYPRPRLNSRQAPARRYSPPGPPSPFQSFHRRSCCRPSPCTRAFPELGLIRRLRPAPTATGRRGRACPPTGLAAGDTATENGSHVHHKNRSTGVRRPAYTPAAIRTSTPQSFLVGTTPDRRIDPAPRLASRQSRSRCRRVCAASRPGSARLEPNGSLRGVRALVPHVRLSVSLLPDPGRLASAGQSRRCQGRLPPFLTSPRSRLPSASTRSLRQTGRWRSFTSTRFK